jgi:hypothetical protein
MECSNHGHIAQKLWLAHDLNHVLIRVESSWHLFRVDHTKLIPRWLDDGLRQRLMILLFDESFYPFAVDFFGLRVVLLVFVEDHFLSFFEIVLCDYLVLLDLRLN